MSKVCVMYMYVNGSRKKNKRKWILLESYNSENSFMICGRLGFSGVGWN